jgi:tetratricopeptide (TPR) repeat protein
LAAYGLSLLGQRKFSDAVQTLEAALELESDNKIIVSALAECYLQEGNRYDKAIELLQPHVQANPVSSKTSILDLRSKFAWALAQAGRIDASKAEINFVLEHSDGKPQNNALFNLMAGHVFLLAREASKAAAFFEVAFENDPNGVTGVEAKRMLEVGLRRSLSGPVGRQPERSSPVS